MKNRYVDTPDGQIHLRVGGTGPTVFLLHQSPMSSLEYRRVVPHLTDRYRALVWDMPGRGNSFDPDRSYEIEDFARAAHAVLDSLDVDRAHLVGHHDGAIMAVEAAAMNPHRFDRVVLNGCAAWHDRFAQRRAASKAATESEAKPAKSRGDRQLLVDTWDGYGAWSVPGASDDQIFPTVMLALQSKLRPQFPDMVPRYLPKIQQRMGLIEGPVLITAGEHDQYYVDEIEATAQLFPEWEQSVGRGYGNFPGAEDPDAFAMTILDFLDG